MIEVNNLTTTVVDKNFFKKVAKIVLKGENVNREKELSIVLINKSKIKELNKKYRKNNQSTDVLAFGEISNFQFPISNSKLGEIVICLEEVKKNAKKVESTFKKELTFVLIHGILHLLGYDHESGKTEAKKMQDKEEHYLAKIFL